MLNGTYATLLPAIAGSAAALIGLLFVAISVANRHGPADQPAVVRQVRAAASILAFSNAITVALFGLVPATNIGYPATVVAIVGVFFTLAGTRSIFTSHLPWRYCDGGELPAANAGRPVPLRRSTVPFHGS